MPRKKSLKHSIKVGSIIRTDFKEFWEVTALLDNKFQCKDVVLLGTEAEYIQEFYYNIDMVVYQEVGRNVSIL